MMARKSYYSMLLALILISGLVVGAASAGLPTANFSANQSYGNGTATVMFSDNSDILNPVNSAWTFGNTNDQPNILLSPPTGFGWTNAPINIYQNGSRIWTTFDASTFKYIGSNVTRYVDITKADTNDGLTPATAFKSVTKALTDGADVIYVAPGTYAQQYSGVSSVVIPKNASIIGSGDGVYLTGFFAPLTWSLQPGYTNIYNASRTLVAGIYDNETLDAYGEMQKYTLSGSLDDVNSTPGYYNYSGGKIYIHTFSGLAPGADTKVVLTGDGINAAGNKTIYLENLNILGSDRSGVNLSITSTSQNATLVMKNVSVKYVLNGNGVEVKGTGFSALQDVSISKSYNDGANYHKYSTVVPNAIEVNVTTFRNGETSDTDNGSTAHDGIKIIRVNTTAFENVGPNIADVGSGTQSWNINTKSYNSSGAVQNYDYISDSGSHIWIYSGTGYGSTSTLRATTQSAISFGQGSVFQTATVDSSTSNITIFDQQLRYFNTPGIYSINHSVTNSSGTSWYNGSFEVGAPLITASFTPTGPINVYYPTGTLFTDTSTGSPTSYDWSYKLNNAGSGISFNTTQNATFFPPKGGNYTISLNASTVSSYNISTQVTWVNVSQADFLRNVTTGYQYPMPVQFTDMSTGVPTNWSWTFGDTYTSTSQNPMHIYTVAGTYNVNLTVWNATWGFVSTQKNVTLSTDDDIWLRAWDQYENATIIDLKGIAWTNSGGVLSAPGKFGTQSLYLTGNNYVYSASSSIWDRSALSGEVEAWFNVTAYGDAGKPFFRRSSGTSGTTNGWGFFNINGTPCGNAFYYGSSTNYTTPFCMPLNTWTHAALVRDTDQYWRVYVNGVLWGTPVYMGGLNVDTANPFMIGSSGPGTEPTFRIDEFRYSQGVPRFITNFSTPYAMYRGSTQPMIDTSPNSTYRYKTNPGSLAIIYNQTNGGTRNRTVQVQNVSEALYLIGGGNFDPRYELVKNVFLNKTDYSDLVLESYSIDNVGGVVTYNVSRGGVNHITAPFDTRTNFLDVQVLYYNYTENVNDFQYFAYGYLINDSSTYPIHNFIATPITYGMWGEPIINFSANTTTPNILSTVQFTDSTLNYPDTYLWDFGDGSTSTLKNPTHVYTSLGTYDVTETAWLAANTSITNTSTKTSYITVLSSAGVPAADFSGSPLVTNIGTPVSFTDLSTGVPTSWVWDFGDSSGSALQNPSHAYSALGLYTVNLTVANVNGTTTMSKTSYVNVTNATMSGYNQQDIEMDPAYTLTLHVVDSSTNAAIPDVSILDSNGNTYNTTTGTFTLSYGYGAVVLYLSSTGYTSKSVSYVMDSDRDETVQMTVEVAASQNTWWTPHTVQVTLMDDQYTNRLTGVTINAAYNESSMPIEWINTLYGIRSDPATDMTNGSLIMSGVTGDDGTVTFTMLGSLKYDFYITSTTYGLSNYHVSAFPSDSMINIYIPVSSMVLPTNKNSTYIDLNGTRVYYYEPDIYNVTMCIDYKDSSGLTTSVTDIWKFANNNTVMNSVTFAPGFALNTNCYTVRNIRGTQVFWYYNATRGGV